jgi:uncharacterized protein (TIGR03086 family)
MTAPSPDQLEASLAEAQGLVAAVRPEQWAAPTPCSEWDVRALVAHLVGGNQRFAGLISGATTLERPRPVAAGDVLGDDPVRAFSNAAEALVAAVRLPGALEGLVTIPFGTVPGAVALNLRLTEVLVHSWDLSRATSQSVRFDDALVEQEYEFSAQSLTQVPPERSPFAAPKDVPAGSSGLDRLAALLGRRVDLWS